MKIQTGDKVKVNGGEFEGYYGLVLEVSKDAAKVTHNEFFEGHSIPLEFVVIDD